MIWYTFTCRTDHLFLCYAGSFSRSAVNFMAGCNTAVSNIVMSGVVFLTLELITRLFKYTPSAILASIIISAVVGLFDVEAAILIWKIDKFDFIACMGAFFGVVFISVEIGLLIAVSCSRLLVCFIWPSFMLVRTVLEPIIISGIHLLRENPLTSDKASNSCSWEIA